MAQDVYCSACPENQMEGQIGVLFTRETLISIPDDHEDGIKIPGSVEHSKNIPFSRYFRKKSSYLFRNTKFELPSKVQKNVSFTDRLMRKGFLYIYFDKTKELLCYLVGSGARPKRFGIFPLDDSGDSPFFRGDERRILHLHEIKNNYCSNCAMHFESLQDLVINIDSNSFLDSETGQIFDIYYKFSDVLWSDNILSNYAKQDYRERYMQKMDVQTLKKELKQPYSNSKQSALYRKLASTILDLSDLRTYDNQPFISRVFQYTYFTDLLIFEQDVLVHEKKQKDAKNIEYIIDILKKFNKIGEEEAQALRELNLLNLDSSLVELILESYQLFSYSEKARLASIFNMSDFEQARSYMLKRGRKTDEYTTDEYIEEEYSLVKQPSLSFIQQKRYLKADQDKQFRIIHVPVEDTIGMLLDAFSHLQYLSQELFYKHGKLEQVTANILDELRGKMLFIYKTKFINSFIEKHYANMYIDTNEGMCLSRKNYFKYLSKKRIWRQKGSTVVHDIDDELIAFNMHLLLSHHKKIAVTTAIDYLKENQGDLYATLVYCINSKMLDDNLLGNLEQEVNSYLEAFGAYFQERVPHYSKYEAQLKLKSTLVEKMEVEANEYEQFLEQIIFSKPVQQWLVSNYFENENIEDVIPLDDLKNNQLLSTQMCEIVNKLPINTYLSNAFHRIFNQEDKKDHPLFFHTLTLGIPELKTCFTKDAKKFYQEMDKIEKSQDTTGQKINKFLATEYKYFQGFLWTLIELARIYPQMRIFDHYANILYSVDASVNAETIGVYDQKKKVFNKLQRGFMSALKQSFSGTEFEVIEGTREQVKAKVTEWAKRTIEELKKHPNGKNILTKTNKYTFQHFDNKIEEMLNSAKYPTDSDGKVHIIVPKSGLVFLEDIGEDISEARRKGILIFFSGKLQKLNSSVITNISEISPEVLNSNIWTKYANYSTSILSFVALTQLVLDCVVNPSSTDIQSNERNVRLLNGIANFSFSIAEQVYSAREDFLRSVLKKPLADLTINVGVHQIYEVKENIKRISLKRNIKIKEKRLLNSMKETVNLVERNFKPIKNKYYINTNQLKSKNLQVLGFSPFKLQSYFSERKLLFIRYGVNTTIYLGAIIDIYIGLHKLSYQNADTRTDGTVLVASGVAVGATAALLLITPHLAPIIGPLALIIPLALSLLQTKNSTEKLIDDFIDDTCFGKVFSFNTNKKLLNNYGICMSDLEQQFASYNFSKEIASVNHLGSGSYAATKLKLFVIKRNSYMLEILELENFLEKELMIGSLDTHGTFVERLSLISNEYMKNSVEQSFRIIGPS